MSIILSIAEYNMNTGDLSTIPYGIFKTIEEATNFAEKEIKDTIEDLIKQFGGDAVYVEENFILNYTIKDISKMYNTGDTHTTEKWQKYLNSLL